MPEHVRRNAHERMRAVGIYDGEVSAVDGCTKQAVSRAKNRWRRTRSTRVLFFVLCQYEPYAEMNWATIHSKDRQIAKSFGGKV
jgi:formylmethanofuran dehydrogenase subunit A